MQLIAANEWNKVWHEGGHKWRIQVRAELVHLDGNAKPHFSITGLIKYQAKNNRWIDMGGGAIHDEILQHFPELQPLVDIHLADSNGVPMHAVDNAGYWAGETKWETLHLDRLAHHLRVSKKQASEMVRHALQRDTNIDRHQAWERTFNEYNMYGQWLKDAEHALSLLNKVAVPA